jgi:hypothetical protein
LEKRDERKSESYVSVSCLFIAKFKKSKRDTYCQESENYKFLDRILKIAEKMKSRGDVTFALDPTYKKMSEVELEELRRKCGIVPRKKDICQSINSM